MNPLLISLLVFAVIFGGALVGMMLRPLLSESHLQPDSRDVVKMATGLIGTLAAQSIPPLADRIWHEQKVPAGKPLHFESSAQSLTFENELEHLTPNNDAQRSLQSR